MPITRRISTPGNGQHSGWTHMVVTRHFTAGIRVVDRKVVAAEAQLHWMIDQRLDKVVELCNSVGSEIKPVERKK